MIPLSGAGFQDLRDIRNHLLEAGSTYQLAMALFDNSPDAGIVVDAAGRIILANQQAEFLFGYSRLRMVGQTVEMLLPEDVRGAHVAHREQFNHEPRVRSMGVGLSRPLNALTATGRTLEVDVNLAPFVTDAGVFTIAFIRRKTRAGP